MRGRRRWLAVGAVAAAVSAGVSSSLVAGSPPEDPAVDAYEPLVHELADPELAHRDEASRRLVEAGHAAIPALRFGLTRSPDPEARWRARAALGRLLLRSRTTTIVLVPIPAGEGHVGSEEGETGRQPDETRHLVRLSRPFLIGRHEVTQEDYRLVTGENPSQFAGERNPVERVSWFDAIAFCNALSEKDRYPPYYELADVRRRGASIASATVSVKGGTGYRLPTEAEWEYACRAHEPWPFHWGTDVTGREANVKPPMRPGGYGDTYPAWQAPGRTTPVGSYAPNRWGLHDVHGNVTEWCWDWYAPDAYLHAEAPEDPRGPATGRHRVVRGGSWLALPHACRSASRFWLSPDERKEFAGFRVARDPSAKPAKRYF